MIPRRWFRGDESAKVHPRTFYTENAHPRTFFIENAHSRTARPDTVPSHQSLAARRGGGATRSAADHVAALWTTALGHRGTTSPSPSLSPRPQAQVEPTGGATTSGAGGAGGAPVSQTPLFPLSIGSRPRTKAQAEPTGGPRRIRLAGLGRLGLGMAVGGPSREEPARPGPAAPPPTRKGAGGFPCCLATGDAVGAAGARRRRGLAASEFSSTVPERLRTSDPATRPPAFFKFGGAPSLGRSACDRSSRAEAVRSRRGSAQSKFAVKGYFDTGSTRRAITFPTCLSTIRFHKRSSSHNAR
jgi:hypothetical protein